MTFNPNIKENQVTDENLFHNRRQILKGLGLLTATGITSTLAPSYAKNWFDNQPQTPSNNNTAPTLQFSNSAIYQPNLPLTPENKVTGYNNFYEFGWDKSDPAALSQNFKSDP